MKSLSRLPLSNFGHEYTFFLFLDQITFFDYFVFFFFKSNVLSKIIFLTQRSKLKPNETSFLVIVHVYPSVPLNSNRLNFQTHLLKTSLGKTVCLKVGSQYAACFVERCAKMFSLIRSILTLALLTLHVTHSHPIINGVEVPRGSSWPAASFSFAVSLQSVPLKKAGAPPTHFCGGTYLGSGWIVTANHCVIGL